MTNRVLTVLVRQSQASASISKVYRLQVEFAYMNAYSNIAINLSARTSVCIERTKCQAKQWLMCIT